MSAAIEISFIHAPPMIVAEAQHPDKFHDDSPNVAPRACRGSVEFRSTSPELTRSSTERGRESPSVHYARKGSRLPACRLRHRPRTYRQQEAIPATMAGNPQ